MKVIQMLELSNVDIVIRMSLSLIAGAIIGLDRSVKKKEFGVRSNAILCLAACTISILQILSVDLLIDMLRLESKLSSVISMDVTRYGAQVIGGIGFLGAGIIVFREKKVRGLTTAVMMWNVTIVGLVIGMGFFYVALINLVFTLIILFISHFNRRQISQNYLVIIEFEYFSVMMDTLILESNLHNTLTKFLNKNEYFTEFNIHKQYNKGIIVSISFISHGDFFSSKIYLYLRQNTTINTISLSEIR